MTRALVSFLAAITLSITAEARTSGTPSATDPSVVIFEYQRDQIYELTGSYGITTQIWTGADERITSIQSGDSEAWDIAVPESRDYVAVKPIVKPPKPTNIVIYTDKRVYTVALSAMAEGGDIRNATYTARFNYRGAVDSLDALAATLRKLKATEDALAAERAGREALSQEFTDLKRGYGAKEQELAIKRAEEERAARLAGLEERLAYEERTRNDLSTQALALRNELSSIRSAKDRQVYEVLESRLAGAEAARQEATRRAAELEASLDAIRREDLARDEARLARELREARQTKADLRAAQARLSALEAERREEAQAARSTVIFDAFDESGGSQTSAKIRAFSPPLEPASFRERRVSARSPDQVFLEDAASRGIDTVFAVQLTALDSKVLQGAILSGTLETAIDTSLSGMVRAVLSAPVYSADGSRILADRGSRLVGEYRNVVQFGTSRVLIAWNRLITADGVSVQLGAPGIDGLGRAGLSGFSDTHFASRFGAAALISILGGTSAFLVSEATDEVTSETAQNVSDNTNEALGRVLAPYLDIPTTVHVHQGAPINVFVARDLDFSKVR